MPINATEVAGFIASLAPALTSGVAANVGRKGRRIYRGPWMNISAVNTLLAIEIFANMRHRIDRAISQWLEAVGVYPERRPAQVAAITLAVLLTSISVRWIIKRVPTYRLAIGYGATAFFVALFIIESISLHQIDAIFYRQVGPILMIGWLWLACGGAAAIAALTEVRSRLSQVLARPKNP